MRQCRRATTTSSNACSRAQHSTSGWSLGATTEIAPSRAHSSRRIRISWRNCHSIASGSSAIAAHANDTAAVLLMLDLGFDPLARGVDRWEPIRWAAFHGNAELVRRLLRHNPPINVPDPTYGGTPLGQCLYGSLRGWECRKGDFATTVRLLLEAGERLDFRHVPGGRLDVEDVLRAYVKPPPTAGDRGAQ